MRQRKWCGLYKREEFEERNVNAKESATPGEIIGSDIEVPLLPLRRELVVA